MKTKQEAADYLQVSTRAIERYVTAGKLTPKYRAGKTGREAVYDEGELEALKTERETPVAETRELVTPPAPASSALARRPSSSAVAARRDAPGEPEIALDDLARMVAITVHDAARLTGLGVGVIERGIAEGRLVALPDGPRGARVVLREAAETFARERFTPTAPTKTRRK